MNRPDILNFGPPVTFTFTPSYGVGENMIVRGAGRAIICFYRTSRTAIMGKCAGI